MFFINRHKELKNIDELFFVKKDIDDIKNMIVIINNNEYSYYYLCKKYIIFKNNSNVEFILKFDIRKYLCIFKYSLKIFYLYDKEECNHTNCIKYLCNNINHYSIDKTKLVKTIENDNLNDLISIFPIKIQDIKLCIECNKIWDFESEERIKIDNEQKICDSCIFNEYIRKKTLKKIDNCMICLKDTYEDENVKTKCNHNFHEKCLNDWLKNNRKCPLCRMKIHDYIEDEEYEYNF